MEEQRSYEQRNRITCLQELKGSSKNSSFAFMVLALEWNGPDHLDQRFRTSPIQQWNGKTFHVEHEHCESRLLS